MVKRRDPKFNITDSSARYLVRLVVIKNKFDNLFYGRQGWFNMPNPNIKVYKDKKTAEDDFKYLKSSGLDVICEELPLVPGLRFDR